MTLALAKVSAALAKVSAQADAAQGPAGSAQNGKAMHEAAGDEDRALMARVAQGDRAAYAELLRKHLRGAVNAAYRILLNPHDAEEVAQEAFLRVWRHAPRWQIDGAAGFRTWLTRIVVNLCIDRKRRPGMEPMDDQLDPVDPAPDPYQHRLANETERRLARALAKLPERQRAALVLCYWEDASNIDAAAALGVSVGALESLLIRGKRSLRAELSADLGDSAAKV